MTKTMKVLVLAVALLAQRALSLGDSLPELKSYCQLEGVVIEGKGRTTTLRMDRGHFAEVIRDVIIPGGDSDSDSSYDDDDDYDSDDSERSSSSTSGSGNKFPEIVSTYRRTYRADTKTTYAWTPGNATNCSIEVYTPSFFSKAPVPRYEEIYSRMQKSNFMYSKQTTTIGPATFDLYAAYNPLGVSRIVVVDPKTGLPYSATELEVSKGNLSQTKVLLSAMFTFAFPSAIDADVFAVNETNVCWAKTVAAPTAYPAESTCTKYVVVEDSSVDSGVGLPPLPNYCAYSLEASGSYRADLLGKKIDNKLNISVVTHNGNCWSTLATHVTEGNDTVEHGVYHYANETYYTWNEQFTAVCSATENVSISSANPLARFYNKAAELFGKNFAVTEESYKGENVYVYTYANNVVKISKTHGFPLYIRYGTEIDLSIITASTEILFDDIRVSMDVYANNTDFTLPVVEGCSAWNSIIPAPPVGDTHELKCKVFGVSESSGDSSHNEDLSNSSKDSGRALMPSFGFVASVLFLLSLVFSF